MKSEIIYLDENNNVTDQEHAVSAIIRQYDEHNIFKGETFMYLNDQNNNEPTFKVDPNNHTFDNFFENLKREGRIK